MNARQYLKALDRLELRQMDVADLLDVAPRTSRRWSTGAAPVPQTVALVLQMMIRHELTAPEALALLPAPEPTPKRKRKRK